MIDRTTVADLCERARNKLNLALAKCENLETLGTLDELERWSATVVWLSEQLAGVEESDDLRSRVLLTARNAKSNVLSGCWDSDEAYDGANAVVRALEDLLG